MKTILILAACLLVFGEQVLSKSIPIRDTSDRHVRVEIIDLDMNVKVGQINIEAGEPASNENTESADSTTESLSSYTPWETSPTWETSTTTSTPLSGNKLNN